MTTDGKLNGSNGSRRRPHVVVAGMGPVGVTAALALGRAGVRVTVLEAGATLAVESRASTFHPPTLEILDELGVAEELMAGGLRAPVFQYRERTGRVLAELDLGLLADDTPFPFRIQNEQNNLTRIAHERLVTLPDVELRFGAPVARVENGTAGVRVFLEGDGLEPSVEADWLIAADGANSAARRSLGIAFEGVTYPESFLVVSTTHEFRDDFPDLAYVSYLSDPQEWGVLLRTPRHWRVLFPVPGDVPAEQLQDPAAVETRMQRFLPQPAPYPVSHTTLYRVHQRVAATFAVGRTLLAGDAAHINNPLGGLGMNSGIQDARAAVDTVLATLAGADPEHCAAAYSRVRRDAAMSHVQAQTQRNYEDLQQDGAERDRRFVRMAALHDDPVRARAHLRQTSMLTSYRLSRGRLSRALRPGRPAAPAPAGRRLSELLGRSAAPLPLPGAYDALSARLLAGAGFAAGFVSGAAVSAAQLGLPDLGYVTGDDLAATVRRMTDAVDVPLLVDADTGFGGVLQVAATVRAYERAGAAGLTLEDQVTPKRCGHLAGVRVVPDGEMTAKIRAAVEARRDLLVVARTDALAVEGLDGAVRRAAAYARAGADLVLVEGLRTAAQIAAVHAAVRAAAPDVLLVLNRSEAAAVPPEPIGDGWLAEHGVALVLHPVGGLLAAAGGLREAYADLARERGLPPVSDVPAVGALTWPELTDAVGLPAAIATEERLLPPAPVVLPATGAAAAAVQEARP